MYPSSIRTVRLQVGDGLRFFGDATNLSVVVLPVIPGGSAVHLRSRYALQDGAPLKLEPSTSVDVPAVDQPGWVDRDGEPLPPWSYRVVVTATAPGRSPVLWTNTIAPSQTQRTLPLDPSSGGKISAAASVTSASDIDPATGGAIVAAGSGGITGATTLNEAAASAA